MNTYKIWLTPTNYTMINAPCPSLALNQVGHRVWKIEKAEKGPAEDPAGPEQGG